MCCFYLFFFVFCVIFFQAEDGIRYLVRSRGLGDVYKRQDLAQRDHPAGTLECKPECHTATGEHSTCSFFDQYAVCLLYTSDAADERSSVDLGGRRIIKKKKH